MKKFWFFILCTILFFGIPQTASAMLFDLVNVSSELTYEVDINTSPIDNYWVLIPEEYIPKDVFMDTISWTHPDTTIQKVDTYSPYFLVVWGILGLTGNELSFWVQNTGDDWNVGDEFETFLTTDTSAGSVFENMIFDPNLPDGTMTIVGFNGSDPVSLCWVDVWSWNALANSQGIDIGQPVPVPSSVILLGVSLLGIAGVRRKI